MPALLRRVQQTYGDAIRATLARAGYDDIPTNGLYFIASVARASEGAPISEFVRQLSLSKQRAGQLVDALVVRGYFSRAPDEKDRRQLIVTLTERGRNAAAILEETRAGIDEALLAEVGQPALETTVRTLTALIDLNPFPQPEI